LLNKADLQIDGGRAAARLLLGAAVVDEVVIAAAETAEPVREAWGRVAAVVLAAGEAKRFGGLKQVMPWNGTPLVAHIVQQVIACPDVAHIVVTRGAQGDRVEKAVGRHAAEIEQIEVEDWREGQSRSVRRGLQAARGLASGRLSAAVFLLADQPGITPGLLSALIQRHRETLAPVVVPRYQGQRGNPVLFDRRTFPDFESLAGDAGARSIILRHAAERHEAGRHEAGRQEPGLAWVDWPTNEILRDIDTPEDYAAAQAGG